MSSRPNLENYNPKFHKTDSVYFLPNDVIEQRRLVAQCEAWRVLMDENIIYVPDIDPKTVLDIGCGTGYVSRKLAARFPNSQVYGVDLSSMPESHSQCPKNLQFVQGDISKLLTNHGTAAADASHMSSNGSSNGNSNGNDAAVPFKAGAIDFIYERLLMLGVTDWPSHIRMLADSLAPGGWMELQEWDFSIWLEDGSNVTHEWPWQEEMIRCGRKKKGLDLCAGQRVEEWMKQAGLVDLKVVKYGAPFGGWGAEKRPQLKAMADYLNEWWPGVCDLMIDSTMEGVIDRPTIEKHKQQMFKDLEKAGSEGKAYEITVCYGRKM